MRNIYIHILLYLTVILICILDIYTGSGFSLKIILILPFYIYITWLSISLTSSIIYSVFVAFSWTFIDYNQISILVYKEVIFNLLIRVSALIILAYLINKIMSQKIMLKEINEKLEKAIEEKNEFVGMAAHDLRTPLSTIFSYTDLLLDAETKNLNERQLRQIHSIRTVCGKMILLLKETLNLTSIESGKLVLYKQPYDYYTTIKEIVEEMQLFAKKKNINIEIESSVNKIMLNIDRKRIGQVIENLLSNAIKFSKTNTSINIKTRQIDDLFVQTDITDQGIGIKDSEVEHIFKPFVKTSSKPTDGEDSTGLGLAIVKKIVEAHGGKIDVISKPNIGSTFSFTIPI